MAVLIFLPNLIWQFRYHFPTWELLNNAQNTHKNVVLGPVAFVLQQIILLHPIIFPIWLAGLIFFFSGSRFRVIACTYVVLLIAFIALKGKNYYLAPVYPVLLAGVAVGVEEWVWRWAQV